MLPNRLLRRSQLKSYLIPLRSPCTVNAMSGKGPEPSIEAFLSDIYSIPHTKFSVHVTGGGVQVLSWLFSVPGASACLMEGSVPYSFSALKGLVGRVPDQYCSADTAIQMAQAARNKNVSYLLAEGTDISTLRNSNVFGVACTASLVSNVPKRGAHRCYVAHASSREVAVASVELTKGSRSRLDEDYVCSRMVLNAISKCCDHPYVHGESDFLLHTTGPDNQLFSEQISVTEEKTNVHELLRKLVKNETKNILVIPGDKCDPIQYQYFEDVDIPAGSLIFPGSFNPLHQGHVAFASVASKTERSADRKKGPPGCSPLVIFEISITNADKAPLSVEEVLRRLALFGNENPAFGENRLTNYALCLSSEPLFLGKSDIFKGCQFLIGADTMVRLLDLKYYGSSWENMIISMARIAERGCSFVVAGRTEQQTGDTAASHPPRFVSCEEVLSSLSTSMESRSVPLAISSLFRGIAESSFRSDISSSAIRANRGLRHSSASGLG